MPEVSKFTQAYLREELDLAIEVVECDYLPRVKSPAAQRALECARIEIHLGPADLAYSAAQADLERLLRQLRALREAPGAVPESPSAEWLAALIVGLQPIDVAFSEGQFGPGPIRQLKEQGLFLLFAGFTAPVGVCVRGTDRAEATRKLSFLLAQAGVPSAEGERRAA